MLRMLVGMKSNDPRPLRRHSPRPSLSRGEGKARTRVTEFEQTGPVIDTSTSGLPITKGKADYLARLEWSRHWIDLYRKAVLDVNRMNDKGEIT